MFNFVTTSRQQPHLRGRSRVGNDGDEDNERDVSDDTTILASIEKHLGAIDNPRPLVTLSAGEMVVVGV